MVTMLEIVIEMKFCLRMAFGDLKNCAGYKFEITTQGPCQGNGAAPAGCAVISTTIIDASAHSCVRAQCCNVM